MQLRQKQFFDLTFKHIRSSAEFTDLHEIQFHKNQKIQLPSLRLASTEEIFQWSERASIKGQFLGEIENNSIFSNDFVENEFSDTRIEDYLLEYKSLGLDLLDSDLEDSDFDEDDFEVNASDEDDLGNSDYDEEDGLGFPLPLPRTRNTKKYIDYGFFSFRVFGTPYIDICACEMETEFTSIHVFYLLWMFKRNSLQYKNMQSHNLYQNKEFFSLKEKKFRILPENENLHYFCTTCGVEYPMEDLTENPAVIQNAHFITFGYIQTEMPLIHPLFYTIIPNFLYWSVSDLTFAFYALSFSYLPILQNWTFFSSEIYYYFLQENNQYKEQNNTFLSYLPLLNKYKYVQEGLQLLKPFEQYKPLLFRKKENIFFIYDPQKYRDNWYLEESRMFAGDCIFSENFMLFYGIDSRRVWPLKWPKSQIFTNFINLFWIEPTLLDKPQIPFLLKQRFVFERTLEIDYPSLTLIKSQSSIFVYSEIAEMILLQNYFFIQKLTVLQKIYHLFLMQYFFKQKTLFVSFLVKKNRSLWLSKKKKEISLYYFTLKYYKRNFYINKIEKKQNNLFFQNISKNIKFLRNTNSPLFFFKSRKFLKIHEKKFDIINEITHNDLQIIKKNLEFFFSIEENNLKKIYFKLKKRILFNFSKLNPFWIILSRILVIPPEYRPLIQYNKNIMDNDLFSILHIEKKASKKKTEIEIEQGLFVSDVNYLYQNLLNSIELYFHFTLDEFTKNNFFWSIDKNEDFFKFSIQLCDHKLMNDFFFLLSLEARKSHFFNMQKNLNELINVTKTTSLFSEDEDVSLHYGIIKPKTVLKSLLDRLNGKMGFIRQYLLGRRVDYSGRSVIVACPDLEIFECGLPFQLACILFAPFLQKMDILQSFTAFTEEKKIDPNDNNKIALNTYILDLQKKNSQKYNYLSKSAVKITWDILERFCKMHPVLLNRAPTLHRKGIQGFIIRLSHSKAIELHPLVCSAFNADFDGDQMAIHLPIVESSRIETFNVLWSSLSLLGLAEGDPIITPTQDMILGLNYMTLVSKKPLLSNTSVHKLIWFDLAEMLVQTNRLKCTIQFENENLLNIIEISKELNIEQIDFFQTNNAGEIHLLENGFCRKMTLHFFIEVYSLIIFFILQEQTILFQTTTGRFFFNINLLTQSSL